jgi:hypothetical protein
MVPRQWAVRGTANADLSTSVMVVAFLSCSPGYADPVAGMGRLVRPESALCGIEGVARGWLVPRGVLGPAP